MRAHHRSERIWDGRSSSHLEAAEAGPETSPPIPDTARVSLYLPDGAAQAVKRLALGGRRRPNAVYAEAILAYVDAHADEAGVSTDDVTRWRAALEPRKPLQPEASLGSATHPRILEELLVVLGRDGGAALRGLLGLPNGGGEPAEHPRAPDPGGPPSKEPRSPNSSPLDEESGDHASDLPFVETDADKRRRVERVKAAVCHELLRAGTDLSFATLMSNLTDARMLAIGGMRPRVNLNTIVHHDIDELFEVNKGMVWLKGVSRRTPAAAPNKR